MLKEGFETFEHGADIGIRGWAPTLEGAFCECARAMFSQMIEGNVPSSGEFSICSYVVGEEDDLVSLLILWLNTLLGEADIESAVFWDFDISIFTLSHLYKIKGWARGISRKEVNLGVEVKGATYTQARVEKTPRGWIAQCVIDV